MKRYAIIAAVATLALLVNACTGEVQYDQTQSALLGFDFVPTAVIDGPTAQVLNTLTATPDQIQVASAYGQGAAELVFVQNTTDRSATISSVTARSLCRISTVTSVNSGRMPNLFGQICMREAEVRPTGSYSQPISFTEARK